MIRYCIEKAWRHIGGSWMPLPSYYITPDSTVIVTDGDMGIKTAYRYIWFLYSSDLETPIDIKLEFFAERDYRMFPVFHPIIIHYSSTMDKSECVKKYAPVLEEYLEKAKIQMEQEKVKALLGKL